MGNAFTKTTYTKTFKKRKKKNKSSNFEDVADVADVADTSDTQVFRFVDGRRYHNAENSNYILPNDDDECDRLHMQHFVFRYAWQSNFASPVEHILNSNDTKVLDAGYTSP